MEDHQALRRHIRTLERRHDYLGGKIGSFSYRTPSEKDYDLAEFHALTAAIEALRRERQHLMTLFDKKGRK